MIDYVVEAPIFIQDFLRYLETNEGYTEATIKEYYLDLRMFLRFMLMDRAAVPPDVPFDNIQLKPVVTREFVAGISKQDVGNYIDFLRSDRVFFQGRSDQGKGLSASTTSRKLATLKTFFGYLCDTLGWITKDPTHGISGPIQRKRLPAYLTEEEAIRLLEAVTGTNSERDYCIITIFLNCGLRISELVGINIKDIHGSIANGFFLNVRGKGDKERQVFLGDACMKAIKDYLSIREEKYHPASDAKDALFITRCHHRMSVDAVQLMVKNTLLRAGLDAEKYSPHKLRHTAATLMLQNGVDIRTLQEVLGHSQLNTTELYTHINNDNLRIAAQANPLNRISSSKPARKNPVDFNC